MTRFWEVVRLESVCNLLLCVILIRMSIRDIKERVVLPIGNIAILILAVVRVLTDTMSLKEHVIGSLSVSGLLCLVNLIRHKSFGGGDIKLMYAVGLYLGVKNVIAASGLGLLVAACWSICIIIAKKTSADKSIPLVPFFSIGIIATIFV